MEKKGIQMISIFICLSYRIFCYNISWWNLFLIIKTDCYPGSRLFSNQPSILISEDFITPFIFNRTIFDYFIPKRACTPPHQHTHTHTHTYIYIYIYIWRLSVLISVRLDNSELLFLFSLSLCLSLFFFPKHSYTFVPL